MLNFHATLHVAPEANPQPDGVVLRGLTFAPLAIRPADLGLPFSVTFEQVTDWLEAQPRLFVEPDGSFVWVSSASEPAWQLDGQLWDREGRLLLIDLKGSCPQAALDGLLTCLEWPETSIVFLLAREGLLLDEVQFRRYAAQPE